MKKILLLILSGLLITCMAGSAMADPCVVTITPDSYNIASGEPTGVVKVTSYIVGGQRTISVKTTSPSIEAEIIGPDGAVGTTGWTSTTIASLNYEIPMDKLDRIILYPGTSTPVVNEFTIKVRHTPGTPLEAGEVKVFANEGSTYISTEAAKDSASLTVGASIPEFPTVALPVAAILGLVFIFGRRKEGL